MCVPGPHSIGPPSHNTRSRPTCVAAEHRAARRRQHLLACLVSGWPPHFGLHRATVNVSYKDTVAEPALTMSGMGGHREREGRGDPASYASKSSAGRKSARKPQKEKAMVMPDKTLRDDVFRKFEVKGKLQGTGIDKVCPTQSCQARTRIGWGGGGSTKQHLVPAPHLKTASLIQSCLPHDAGGSRVLPAV